MFTMARALRSKHAQLDKNESCSNPSIKFSSPVRRSVSQVETNQLKSKKRTRGDTEELNKQNIHTAPIVKYQKPSGSDEARHKLEQVLDLFSIVRRIREDNFRVQQAFELEEEHKWVIITDCEENTETIQKIESRLEIQRPRFHLRVTPITQTKLPRMFKLVREHSEQAEQCSSEFAVVLKNRRGEEVSWCTNAVFLVKPNDRKEQEFPYRFYSISTFHIFERIKFLFNLNCRRTERCKCCHWSHKQTFLDFWECIWEEGRCQDHEMLANFLGHLNRLIEQKRVSLNLVNGETSISVKYVVAADYQTTGPNAQDDFLDGFLMKLDDHHVINYCEGNIPLLGKIHTAHQPHNHPRIIDRCLSRGELKEPKHLVSCCRSMSLPQTKPDVTEFSFGLDYRRPIYTTTPFRALGQGQSGSGLFHLKSEDHVDVVGYLHGTLPVNLHPESPNNRKLLYAFIPIMEQIEALLEFNKKFPFDRPIIEKLSLPSEFAE